MATSAANGMVDTAIYSRPHVQGNDRVAFIMRDHLTHKNLQENAHANYLFLEEGHGYSGVRLFLIKLEESTDHALIESMTRRSLTAEEDKVLQLIGGTEIPLEG